MEVNISGCHWRRSGGNGKFGKRFVYLRPNEECMNRSYRIGGFENIEIDEKVQKTYNKHFAGGVKHYNVNGWKIGSNNPQNALKEYWRVCDLKDAKAKKQFPVIEVAIDAPRIIAA